MDGLEVPLFQDTSISSSYLLASDPLLLLRIFAALRTALGIARTFVLGEDKNIWGCLKIGSPF